MGKYGTRLLIGLAGSFLLLLPVLAHSQETLRLANPTTFLTGLITLAQHRQTFAAHGLTIISIPVPTGDEALTAVEQKQADLATAAETAFTLHSLTNPSWRLLAEIGDWDNEVQILARRDAEIHAPKDLRGKRIGTQNRLSTFFFLDQYLMKQGLSLDEITIHFMQANELAEALATEKVQAISARDPYLSQAKNLLGPDNIRHFAAPGLYRKTFLLASDSATIAAKKEAISRFLQALIQTEEFVRKHPLQARQLLQQHHAGEADLQRIWQEIRLAVWLDQHLLLTMEQVAAWAMRNKMVPTTAIPNFLHNVDPQPLRQIRPIAVNLLQ
ncbi:ABC transporter substrate-binding protein [Candidatus Magnetaquicoccus inordinatus]|uniref:ABC transporter substrate-binding protein n=1 Tax=Candidatus Magnetaquicoccus inordinatus TaxID=2496818 RepID=UPI00102C07FE|nr:ABC transporter substrate-binding protein [Candidatus Magnetaquicoccus inordinatus]